MKKLIKKKRVLKKEIKKMSPINMKLFPMYTLLALLLALNIVQGQTPQDTGEVCKRYSTEYGVKVYADPEELFQTRYYTEEFVDDRNAQIVGIRYCLNDFELLFKGFQAQYQTSSGLVVQTYGTMDDVAADANNCFPADGSYEPLSEDIVRFAVFVDANDVEGLLFVTETGTELRYKANYPIYEPFPAA